MKNKRGMSGIIVTLITILLAIVAIGIVWVVVSNIIENYSEKIEMGSNSITLRVVDANIEGSDLKVKIKRGVGAGEIDKIKLLIYDNNEEPITHELDFLIEESEAKIATIDVSELTGISKIEVIPIGVSDSGKEFMGAVSEEYKTRDSIPKEGMVLDISFEEGTKDNSGNENNGKLEGGAKIISDTERGNVLDLSRETDSMVVNPSSSLDFDNQISVSFWVNWDSFNIWDSLVSGTISEPWGQSYWIANLENQHIRTTFQDETDWSNTRAFLTGNNEIEISKWYNVLVVYDGTSLSTYLNGEKIKTISKTLDEIKENGVRFGITRTEHPFEGKMDNIIIYNKALSDSDAKNLYYFS